MKGKLRKLIGLIMVMCISFMASSNVFAATVENNTTEIYNLTEMVCDGQIIEIPVLTRTTTSKSRTNMVTSETYVFVPDMAEDTMEKNEQYVNEIKETGNCSIMSKARSNYFGIRGYIAYYSTLNYNVSYYDGYLRMYDIISFKVEREIYTQAPFGGFFNPSVRVLQVGTVGDSGDLALLTGQVKDYDEIQYNTLYSLPTEWQAVCQAADGPLIGVKYTIKHKYSDGTVNYLEYFHEAK